MSRSGGVSQRKLWETGSDVYEAASWTERRFFALSSSAIVNSCPSHQTYRTWLPLIFKHKEYPLRRLFFYGPKLISGLETSLKDQTEKFYTQGIRNLKKGREVALWDEMIREWLNFKPVARSVQGLHTKVQSVSINPRWNINFQNMKGIATGVQNINNTKYADVTVVIAYNK